ncbi:GGDEF domain-containing protein [Deinococcus sp. YIM 134068]|uniref:GGDEF domain-containing protein n=1 Tax=Deinococcus lichenicola TaxID=3118910 RepID=UPI002F956746
MRALERVVGGILPVVGVTEVGRAALEWTTHPLEAWLNLLVGILFLLGTAGMALFPRSRLLVIRLAFLGLVGLTLAFEALGYRLLPPGTGAADAAYLLTGHHLYLSLVLTVCCWLLFPPPWAPRLALAVYVAGLVVQGWSGGAALLAGEATAGGVLSLLLHQALVGGCFYLLMQVLTLVYVRQARLEQERTRLDRFAHLDPLTNLLNRRAFDQALGTAAGRADAGPLSLITFDIDAFKNVNDTHGHPVGDRVLRDLADLARREARADDVLARWGGEEFAWLLPGVDLAAASRCAERLRAAVEAHDFGVGRVTLSLGVAAWQSGDTPDTLFQRADDLLYVAKRGGRNRVEVALAS